MIELPDGSIYFWMYTAGLKHVPLEDIRQACFSAGKNIRKKDEENYWNGYYRSDLYDSSASSDIGKLVKIHRQQESVSTGFLDMPYSKYLPHPYEGMPDIDKRYVPCNADNRPIIRWSEGCMTIEDARAMMGQVYMAENLKGCKHIVIDCDGDHSDKLDLETINFLWKFSGMTHTMRKPKSIKDYEGYEQTGLTRPASFHLSFRVDRVIPTMHFPWANIDIVGNRANSLRYFKNKKWNGLPPIDMTDEIWDELRRYIRYRKEKADGKERHEPAGHVEEQGISESAYQV